MKILLTGASGEIGTPLLARLADDGHELFVTTRHTDRDPAPRWAWIQADVRYPNSLDAARACAPDAVVHMAAVTHARKATHYDEVNVAGTANLVRAFANAPLRRFVHLSTRAIGQAGGGYAASKERAEKIVTESDLPWTILRPAEVYGSGGTDPILSLAADLKRRRFVPILGDGSYHLAPVAAADVVDALVQTLARDEAIGRTYVLAGPESMTYLELVARLEAMLGLPRRRRVRIPLLLARGLIRTLATFGLGGYVPDQVPRLLQQKSADNSAAARDLGFAPRDLETGLRTFFETPHPQAR